MTPRMVTERIKQGLASVRQAFRASLQGVQLGRPVQLLRATGLAGEPLPDVELMQHFGLTSAPPDGAQLIAVPLGGRTSATVIVASEHGSYRLRLGARGEVALYNQWGDHVHLQADGTVHLQARTQVVIDAPTVRCTGDLEVDGQVRDLAGTSSSRTMAQMRATYSGHTHPETNTTGGSTGTPDQPV